MPPSTNPPPDLFTLEVYSDGRLLSDGLPLLSVRVRRALGHVATVHLAVLVETSPSGDLATTDDPAFKPGARIRVVAADENGRVELFEGLVAQLGLRATANESIQLLVECRGDAADVTPALLNTADPRATAPSVLEVRWGVNLVELRADVESSTAPATVNAQACAALVRLRGRMKLLGSASLQPGQRVTIAGVGNRFSGEAFLTTVEHEFSNGGWLTSAEFGLAPETLRP